MAAHAMNQPLKVYWQPGCSSCLKTKEFLLANGVEFESINVLEDDNGFRELEALGLRMVPIVARGSDWANASEIAIVAMPATPQSSRRITVPLTRSRGYLARCAAIRRR